MRKGISISLPEELIVLIDDARGQVSRSRWIAIELERAAGRAGGDEGTAAPPATPLPKIAPRKGT